jgi:quinol monooxygenase YgiN
MNKVVFVMRAKSGKVREAIAATKTLVEYIRSKHGLQSEVYLQAFGGTLGTIYLIGEYKDAASAQAAQAKIMADGEYWAIAQKLVEVIVDPPTMTFLQPV